jgi:hypothetical protein
VIDQWKGHKVKSHLIDYSTQEQAKAKRIMASENADAFQLFTKEVS